ncbi:hypothetical protein [Demequina globuliformis]|uniref:hypothetical protein n=1 Tax=Demequina globuliformis TaxID=676202 RepID=UPI0007807F58|nr:hypothetical protein [Demequina globuliformis]
MTQAHIDGILALLTDAGITAYDTEAEESPSFPYVVVAAPSFTRIAASIDDVPRDFHEPSVKVTGAGTGREQARWVQEKAYAALDRKSPIVTGYRTDIRRTATGILAADREVTLPGSGHPIYATDTYLYRATPTA